MAEKLPAYQEFTEKVIKYLVTNPDNVKVEKEINELGVLLKVDLDPKDASILIGKKGRTIQALRRLLRIIGLKNRAYVTVRLKKEVEGAK